MANTISNLQIQTFERNLRFLAQQGDSLLQNWCQVVNSEAVSHNFDVLGQMSMTQKTTRATASPVNDAPWGRRQSLVTNWAGGDLVEHADVATMLVDPNSGITRALAMAARRKIDSLIIAAATGNSRDGAGGTVAYGAAPTSQVTIGAYATEISFDTVTQVYEAFMNKNVMPDEEKVFVIAPKQLRKFQQLVEYTSSDYANVKALAENGFVRNWMGFTFIVSNLLGVSTTDRDCFAATRKGIGLHFAKNIWARVAEDPSRSFATQIYTEFSAGAVRVEDEQVVWVKCKDTVT
jgi:hypothetical protein